MRECRVCGRDESQVGFSAGRRICHTCRSRQAPSKAHLYAPTHAASRVAAASPPRPVTTATRPVVVATETATRPPAFNPEDVVDATPGQRTKRLLFVPDCHHPNVHMDAWGLMLRAAHRWRPDVVVVLGDFLDGESLSLHEPDEPTQMDFETELDAVAKALAQLDELDAETKIYIEGNHEQRLSRFLARRAPALYRSMSLPEMLRLHDGGWQWIPYRKSVRIGRLHLTHDTGSAGANAHRFSARAFMGSAIIGHTHRLAYEVTGRFDATPYLAAMFGWLGDATTAGRYLHEAKSAEWVHGFGVGLLEESSGVVHVQPVPIVAGRAFVAGELVE